MQNLQWFHNCRPRQAKNVYVGNRFTAIGQGWLLKPYMFAMVSQLYTKAS